MTVPEPVVSTHLEKRFGYNPETDRPTVTLSHDCGITETLIKSPSGDITAVLWNGPSPPIAEPACYGHGWVVKCLRPQYPHIFPRDFATYEEAIAYIERGCVYSLNPPPPLEFPCTNPHAYAVKEGKDWVVYAWGETEIGRYGGEAMAWFVADELNNPPWGETPDWDYIDQC